MKFLINTLNLNTLSDVTVFNYESLWHPAGRYL